LTLEIITDYAKRPPTMAGVDFARLRNQTMADGQDSEVTVNTRALIDKVLARYSSEHTTLRELIQNASDAGASTVVIKFETDPSLEVPTPQGSEKSILLKHIIQQHTLKRLIVSNNGQPFTAADWSRV
jgi:HSP90 family molecular chaperone